MQNRVNRNYRIGNVVIGYEGPYFEEKEYLSSFRESEEQCDIRYQMISKKNIECPDIPCVNKGAYIDVYREGKQNIRVIYAQDREQIIMKDIFSSK